MLCDSKATDASKPALLLNLYNIFSLFILICCIVVIACIYTFSYIKEEKFRSHISLQQLEHFLDFQYRAMAEEFWTGNYESILMRTDDIANRFGHADYKLYILDNAGRCLATSTHSGLNQSCTAPSRVTDAFNMRFDNHQKINFDLNLNNYVYFTALSIEPQKTGFIYIEMSDPYHFYHGSLLQKLWGSFFLKLLAVIFVWLLWLLISKRLILRPYFIALAKSEKNEALGSLASQVAHDIQSPLAALEMIIQSTNAISEDKRILIRSAVSRVRDIANNLLSTHRKSVDKTNSRDLSTGNEPLTCQIAATLIESILTEKRLEFRSKISIAIEGFLHSEEAYGLFIKVQLGNFKRVISNIINNSVESIVNSGIVRVSLKQSMNDVDILIQDSGVGIPPKVLSLLGERGMTYGKLNGNGLGIYHAKKILSNCNGQLHIDSKLNEGTLVKITLPKAEQPIWFTKSLIISPQLIICITDDDESIHQIWNKRFSREGFPAGNERLAVNHFSSPAQLIDWHDKNKFLNQDILFLCDYEFLKKDINGIDLIKKLRIAPHSVLVTSHYEEQRIQIQCIQLGIKLLPKSMAAFIPLTFVSENI